jgi:ABC-2 type transport system ATP-binding protein
MNSPLKIENLVKTYGSKSKFEVRAVRGVSFSLKPGEIFGLLGPNGAGKTSIISVITTLEKATSGDVLVCGESVSKRPDLTKRMLGVVPQEVMAQGFFNLVEILDYQSGYHGILHNEERIEYLLKRLQLWEHRSKQVKQLSGGMKRRMMIAKALVHSPKLLLLDEPTAGVDVELRKSLWEFVLELKSQGVAILLTTHYLQEAEELCDRIGIIHQGELKWSGETQKIISELTSRSVEVEMNDHQKFQFQVPKGLGIGGLLAEKKINLNQIKDIRTNEGTLEEAFLNILKGHQ